LENNNINQNIFHPVGSDSGACSKRSLGARELWRSLGARQFLKMNLESTP
jgi:hypothetical protein